MQGQRQVGKGGGPRMGNGAMATLTPARSGRRTCLQARGVQLKSDKQGREQSKPRALYAAKIKCPQGDGGIPWPASSLKRT